MISAPLRRGYMRSRNAHKKRRVKTIWENTRKNKRGKTISEEQELKERVDHEKRGRRKI